MNFNTLLSKAVGALDIRLLFETVIEKKLASITALTNAAYKYLW